MTKNEMENYLRENSYEDYEKVNVNSHLLKRSIKLK